MNARVGKRSPFDSGNVASIITRSYERPSRSNWSKLRQRGVVNCVNLAGHRPATSVRHDDREAGPDRLVGRYGDGLVGQYGDCFAQEMEPSNSGLLGYPRLRVP